MYSGGSFVMDRFARFQFLSFSILILSGACAVFAWLAGGLWYLVGASIVIGFPLIACSVLAHKYRQLDALTEALEHHQTDYRHFPIDRFKGFSTFEHLKRYLLEHERHAKHQTENFSEFAHMAQELANSAEVSASNADEQKQAISSSAAAVTELSQSIEDVAGQVGSAHQNIESSRRETRQSLETAQATIQDIQSMTQLADQTADLVNQLYEQSNNVMTMSGIIQDIADQTNLLSLNAAIEAARAGEKGMGFAVVADEVRKLSHRSRDSAEEIVSSIAQVQSQMEQVKSQVDDVVDKAKHNLNSVDAVGKTLSSLDDTMEDLSKKVYVIATAAEQQSLATNEISTNIEVILQQAEETSAIAGETVSISQYLSHKVAHNRSGSEVNFS